MILRSIVQFGIMKVRIAPWQLYEYKSESKSSYPFASLRYTLMSVQGALLVSRSSKHLDQPVQQTARRHGNEFSVTTSRLQQQQATSGARTKASRKLWDQLRAKQYSWKPTAEKSSSTKPSRWRDGWNTAQSSTPERTLLPPQHWTPPNLYR